MKTIKNTTARAYVLPGRVSPDGEKFGEGVRIDDGQSLQVPDWYFDALRAEKNGKGKPTGWALRMNADGVVASDKRLGHIDANAAAKQAVAAANEQIRASDSRAAIALDDARRSREIADAAQARVAELEAALAAKTTDTKKADADPSADKGDSKRSGKS